MKLSELTTDNIRNTKIHVRNEHESRAFQEAVFKLGAKWLNDADSLTVPQYLNRSYLTINEELVLKTGSSFWFGENVTRRTIQIDFTNKPSWENAPDWAQWLAQDANGNWNFYQCEPHHEDSGCEWYLNETSDADEYMASTQGIPNSDWRSTLEQRPRIDWEDVHKLRPDNIVTTTPDHIPDAKKKINHIPYVGKMVSSQGLLDGSQIGGNHYQHFKVQPLDFILANGLDFAVGNVIKYVCRAKHKNGVEDLRKAKHYIDILIRRELDGVSNINNKPACDSKTAESEKQ